MNGEAIAYFRLRSPTPLAAPMTLLSHHDTRNPTVGQFLALARKKRTNSP